MYSSESEFPVASAGLRPLRQCSRGRIGRKLSVLVNTLDTRLRPAAYRERY